MEQKHNNEQQPIDTTSSSHNAKPHVVGIPSRAIKFRAWYKKGFGERMKYGLTPNTFHNQFPSNAEQCMVLMQFTGLYDCDGKDMYEGDIVYLGGIGNCAVVFSHAGWAFEDKEHLCFFNETEWSDVGHIIGNVFQNPELLG